MSFSPSAARPVNRTRVLISCILASSMAFIDMTALNVAMPAIQRGLGASGGELIWIFNGYTLPLSALLLIGGALGDRRGLDRVLEWGIVLFGLASLLCAIAPSAPFLIGARALQGVGAALLVPNSLALLSSVYGDQRGRAIGIWSTFSTLTTTLGPVLGGLFAELGLWRWIFLINLPVGALAIWMLVRNRLPARQTLPGARRARPLDPVGSGLIAAGLGLVTYGSIEASEHGMSQGLDFGVILAGIALIGLFIVHQFRSDEPMMPPGLFRSRVFAGANLVTLLVYGAMNSVTLFLPLNLVQVQGYGEAAAGLAMLPIGWSIALISAQAGKLADRFGVHWFLGAGPLTLASGFWVISLAGQTQGPSAYWTTFFPGVLLMGIGLGLTVAPLTAAVMSAVPVERSGVASGVNNAISRMSAVLAVAALGSVLLAEFRTSLRDRTAGIGMAEAARAELHERSADLAETEPPEDLAPEARIMVERAIDASFVEAARHEARAAAAVAAFAAAIGFTVCRPRRRRPVKARMSTETSG